MSYSECAMMRFAKSALCLAFAIGGMMLAGSCDYPEQGCFQLTAFDAYGEPIVSFPFTVEELTDDTHMTVGFNVLVPVEGELLELPLDDASDTARRAWSLWLNDFDLGLGDVDLTLSHAQELLSFSGAYRAHAFDTPEALIPPPPPAQAFAGFVKSTQDGLISELIFNGDPPQVSLAAGAVRWQFERLSWEEFEVLLGGPIEDAVRRLSSPRDPLQPVEVSPEQEQAGQDSAPTEDESSAQEEQAEDDAAEDDSQQQDQQDKPKPPPLGGRGGTRPR